MKTRLSMSKVQPAAYKALNALDKYVLTSGVNMLHQEMIRIRASQINGCAYCVNYHTKDARKLGETEQPIYLISVWREVTNVFSEEEQLILAITEEVTLIHEHGLSDDLYEKAVSLFGEEKTAQLIMTIITINVWNRIGVGLSIPPQL